MSHDARSVRTALSLCFLAAIATGLHAAEPPDGPKPTFRVERATGPIRIDGVLDEVAWEGAVEIPLAWEWNPGENEEAPVGTVCRVAFDDDHLYVAFRADDPEAGRIRAHLAARDEPFQDDTPRQRDVDVYFDPVEARTEELVSQLLFSYEVDPRTVVLAGSSDDRERSFETGLEPAGHTFFLKIGYALLL